MKSLPVPFLLGCVLAAVGAFLVARYAPSNTANAAVPRVAPQTVPANPAVK